MGVTGNEMEIATIVLFFLFVAVVGFPFLMWLFKL